MNLCFGYDAMALGNREFDNPLEVPANKENGLLSPSYLRIFIKKVPGERLFKPYTIFDKQGKIAVLGLTTDDTVRIGNPANFPDN